MPVKYKLGTGDTVDITAITKTNQGAGSGLDSDLLDGLHGADLEQIANKGVASGYASLNASSLVVQNPASKGQANGLAELDSGGKVPSSQLPGLAITDVWTVASETEQLALTAQKGDIAIRTDQNKSYAHNGGTAGTMADWSLLLTPTDAVLSVNGETGAVILTTGDLTEDANKKYVTDADITKLSNLSGTNTGDQTLAGLGGIAHSLATAIDDFLVASGAGVFVKKTLAEARTTLGCELTTNKNQASGYAGLDAAALLALALIPATLTGKDADTLDGLHRASYEELARKGVASGYCDLDASILVPLARIPATLTGKDADTVDSFHGADLEKLANKNVANGYPGLGAGSLILGTQITYGSLVNTACGGNDSRLSDARTPTAHATSHERGGSDIVKASRLYSGLDASKPGTGNTEGDVWWATDTDKLYVWDGTAWKDIIGTGGGATTFLGLTDTPSVYTGAGKKLVRVNTGATALEFLNELDNLFVGGRLGVGTNSTGALVNIEEDSTSYGTILRLKDTRATPSGQNVLSFLNSSGTVFYIDNFGDVVTNGWLEWGRTDTAKYGRLAGAPSDGFIGLGVGGTDANINLALVPKGTGVIYLGGAVSGLEVDTSGYLKPINVSLPIASSTYRGKIARVEGGTGVADGAYICEKDVSGGYAWRSLDAFVTGVYANIPSQTLTNNVVEQVQYATEVYDYNNEFASYVFTAKVVGLYLVTAGVEINVNGSTGYREITLRKNSVSRASHRHKPDGTVTDRLTVSEIINLAVNDTIDVTAFQNSGANIAILANVQTFFTVVRVY